MRKLAIVLGVVALAAASSVSVGQAADDDGGGATIKTRGKNGVRINEVVFSTLRFTPERVGVRSGERITLVHADKTQDPHSLTVVREAELPDTVDEVFNCKACSLGQKHFESNPPDPRIEDDEGDGEVGLDGRGDSLLIFPGDSIVRQVSAPSGSQLYYLCFIHPWMQGRINVR